jgi:hypothetical protein
MVAGRDGVNTVTEQFLGDVGRDAVAAGGIFTVGDDDIKAVRLLQLGKKFFDRASAGTADDVTDEQNFHWKNLTANTFKDTQENGPTEVGPSKRM